MRQAGARQHFQRLPPRPPAVAGAVEGADHHVVHHREVREGLDDLEGPGQPEPADQVGPEPQELAAVQVDAPRVRPEKPRDHGEQRGLAGAIRADQAQDLGIPQAEVDFRERPKPAEALGDSPDLQRRHG